MNYYFDNIDENELNKKQLQMKRRRISNLRKEAVQSKINLSLYDEVSLYLTNFVEIEDYDVDEIFIQRKEFEEKCEEKDLFDNFRETLWKVIKKARFNRNNTDKILLIGGTSQIPCVRNIIFNYFDKNKLSNPKFDPLTSVALGAAYQSYLKTSIFNQNSFEDCISIPIGIETKEGKFDAFFNSGDKIPNTSVKEFIIQMNNQTKYEFNIYQGEDEYVDNVEMKCIDKLIITNLPQGKNEMKIEIIVKINTDGLIYFSGKIIEDDLKEKTLEMYLENEKTENDNKEIKNHLSHFGLN